MSNSTENTQSNKKIQPIIKVIGVGGGGSNAVTHMYNEGIVDVDFYICNTDAQALSISPVENKIQIGQKLTEGRGAGNNPEVGKNATLESREEIIEILEQNTKMLFITAGMGGGTGTGAAPVIAEIAKELGIITIGIITTPFDFEGKVRMRQAIKGVEEIEKHVDSLLIINNEKLRRIFGELTLSAAFGEADNILAVAAKGIAEIITVHGHVNVDFADVETVMKDSGVAILGSAIASGENRSIHAIKKALNSPLLNSNDISGARNILLNVTSGTDEFKLDELGEITDYVQSLVKDDVQIIWGNGIDPQLEESIRVVIIATGFKKKDVHKVFAEKQKETDKLVVILEDKKEQKTTNSSIIGSPIVEKIETVNEAEVKYNDVVEKHELIDKQPVVETVFSNIQMRTQENTAAQRAKTIKTKTKKKAKRKSNKSITTQAGAWIQTTLDSLFSEENR